MQCFYLLHFNIQTPAQNISSTTDFITPTQLPLHTSTTPKTIKFEEAHDICWTSFMNSPGLYKNLINGCLDRNLTMKFCIDDVTFTNDPSAVKIHIESSIDMTIQDILTNQSNCHIDDLQMLCPNSCSGNGVCKFEFFPEFFFFIEWISEIILVAKQMRLFKPSADISYFILRDKF
ncbi:hypothetical protein BpHYR1_043792 [Brachionus plicatilis]|uniref:Uncharacterized protein n=1 Tax=Brachionus plicatilis TaxID=10195 RepID=A0A3M7QNU2_BRAPC|nr:hypothetical protein BpHYR1_043792 [Brachionus plicatilis]